MKVQKLEIDGVMTEVVIVEKSADQSHTAYGTAITKDWRTYSVEGGFGVPWSVPRDSKRGVVEWDLTP